MSTTNGGRNGLLQQIWLHKRLYLYIAPSLLLLITFSYWPAISALYHAFSEWSPFAPPRFIGLANFRELYKDLFQPAVALDESGKAGMCPVFWSMIQYLGWAGSGAMLLFFVAIEAAHERRWDWLRWPANGVWAAAVLLALASLVNGLTDSPFLIKHHLFSWFLAGHLGFLATAVIAFYGWRDYLKRPRGWGWRLLVIGTIAAVFFSFALLLNMSKGGDLRASVWNLVRVMTFGLTIGLFMPLVIAEILFHLRSERSKYAYRVLFIIPMVVPGIVGVLMWQFIYDYTWGVLNGLIDVMKAPAGQIFFLGSAFFMALYLLTMQMLWRKRKGLGGGWAKVTALVLISAAGALVASYLIQFLVRPNPVGFTEFACRFSGTSFLWDKLDLHRQNWLGDPDLALYSVMFMGFPWVGTVSMLIFYAGLQAIPTSVLESAKLDGATGLRRFFSIDFPLILGQFKLLLILGIIGGIQGFQSVLILTYGGPAKATDMPGLRMFKEAFDYARLGYGTAIGVVMFLVILGVTYINMKYIRPSAEEEAR